MQVHGIIIQVDKRRAVFRDVTEADMKYMIDYSPSSKTHVCKKVDATALPEGAMTVRCYDKVDANWTLPEKLRENGNGDAQLDR